MRELDVIVAQYNTLKRAGTESVLATVVHVEGSSYRRAGARMLVDEFGNITGAISGGCLEGDALRKALHAMHQQKNKLVTYDTSEEDDALIGAQLGCNGIIQVLFEYLDFKNEFNPCEILKTLISKDQKLAIVVQFNLDKSQDQPGTKFFINEDLQLSGEKPEKQVLDLIIKEGELSLKNDKPHFAEISIKDKTHHFFIQNYKPPVKLVLVGAGNDAQILAQQTELLGWDVIVTDGRPTHANKERFASSCQVIVSKPEETLSNIRIDALTCFVLMSHNYNYDLAVLKLLMNKNEIPYIGILGPRKKFERMRTDLRKEGFELNADRLVKIHAPVGLEIGAETPAEIGLSILAEIQSVLTGKSARPLKQKETPIHDKKENHFKEIQL
ncbi:XdhC family protein [Christiangramia forsetii]|uniref:XdhC/CoxI type molybdenum-dependent oxidoreductase accessory protein n=2 Tax=Christiangramia forsetii TaxID=411153 RepID=A0LYI6_CHRFK|nr:XdhC/CoxI family protein [Christiangramia forsetii]GGG34126.1 putative xanthine dehydrogenase subunit A [Christiangramia forsetii]CAL65431.1 XdhC/CoxI type molybdenum-dependent oxidoreductase accessory protein [Christiangramia forsetii KT0803]